MSFVSKCWTTHALSVECYISKGLDTPVHRVHCKAKFSRIETFQFFLCQVTYMVTTLWMLTTLCHDASLVCIQPCVATQVLLKNAPTRLVCQLPKDSLQQLCTKDQSHGVQDQNNFVLRVKLGFGSWQLQTPKSTSLYLGALTLILHLK